MDKHHHVNLCRWSVPTLYLPYPLWLSTEEATWSCVRDGKPVPLHFTDACSQCTRFEGINDPALDQNPHSHAR
jgi:hypothetical protein